MTNAATFPLTFTLPNMKAQVTVDSWNEAREALIADAPTFIVTDSSFGRMDGRAATEADAAKYADDNLRTLRAEAERADTLAAMRDEFRRIGREVLAYGDVTFEVPGYGDLPAEWKRIKTPSDLARACRLWAKKWITGDEFRRRSDAITWNRRTDMLDPADYVRAAREILADRDGQPEWMATTAADAYADAMSHRA